MELNLRKLVGTPARWRCCIGFARMHCEHASPKFFKTIYLHFYWVYSIKSKL